MPSLDKLASTSLVKMLLMGDSGTGKTGSLVSLVAAGYKLRILDYDGGLPVLLHFIRKTCPDKLSNVEARTLDDKYVSGAAGRAVRPFAYQETVKMLTHWKYTYNGEEVDYGDPSLWGPDCILVVDTLTFLSNAAFNWAEGMNPGAKDRRTYFYVAQQSIEKLLSEFKADSFATNLIVVSHIKYLEREGDGATKGYPMSAGSALSPNIPTYFNSVAQAMTKTGGRRTLQTKSTPYIDLKNPNAFEQELPLETGLATFFEALRGPLCKTNDSKASPTANPPETPAISQTQTTQKLSQMPTTEVKPTSAPLIISPASVKSTQPSKVLTPPLGPRSPLLSTVSKK